MNSLLENQRIGKRKSFTRAENTGITTRVEENSIKLIEQIKQHPARAFHQKHNPTIRKRRFGFPWIKPKRKGNVEFDKRRYEEVGREKPGERKPIFSFSLSAIPLSALLFVALGVFVAIYAKGISLDWMDRDVVSSGRDQGIEYNLALYAGLNPVLNQSENQGGESVIPELTEFLDLTETFAWQNYKVKKGDSVSKIAASFSVSMDAIIASNGITNARSLREGEVLKIPNMDGIPYTVKSGDSLAKISQSMGVPLEAILDANDIQSDTINVGMTLFIPGARMKREDLKLALGELLIYPIKGGRLTSPFGWRNDPISGVRRHHAAVDLAAPQGTPVKAAMEGKISAVGYNSTYGNYVIISHPGAYQTMYAHLHTVSIKNGDSVAQGAQIGTVGNTGYSTGPHLHFAVYRNGRAVNPLDLLNPQK